MSSTSLPPEASDRTAGYVADPADISLRLIVAGVKVFGERGFDAATVAEIAGVAGVTTGALFRRWKTKHELFAAVVEHVCEPNLLAMPDLAQMSAAGKLRWLASNLLVAERNGTRDVRVEACISAARDAEMRSSLARLLASETSDIAALLAEGEASGEIDLEFDDDVLAFFCQALTIGTHILRRALEGEQYVPSDREWRTFAAQMFEYLNLHPHSAADDNG